MGDPLPRNYWAWWWGGCIACFSIGAVATALAGHVTLGSPIVDFLQMAAWIGLALVGWLRNRTGHRNFAFWWSVALLATLLLTRVGMVAAEQLPSGVLEAFDVLNVLTLVVGGLAVIIIWIVRRPQV